MICMTDIAVHLTIHLNATVPANFQWVIRSSVNVVRI